MRGYDETVLSPDLFLNLFDFIIRELKVPSAADAPDVTVMFMSIDMFIVEVAILEKDLFDQSTLDEQGNSSVNRSLGNDLLLVSHAQKKPIYIEVIMSRKNLLNDHLPFRRVPKPSFLDITPEFSNLIHDLANPIIIETHFQQYRFFLSMSRLFWTRSA